MLDPSNSKNQSYHAALVQFICMAMVAEKQTPKRLSLKKGLSLWDDKGLNAVKAELTQIHLRNVFTPLDASKLTLKEMREALESHLFLEQKRNLDVKGRIVGGGDKQRSYTSKEEASSPTSHTEAVFLTAAIEASEDRDSAIVDIPNAFVQTDLIKNGKPVEVIMAIRGQLADMLIEIAPEVYGPGAIKDKRGNTVIYVKLLKALYGLMEASLMFYQKLVKDLAEKAFEPNPYDPCVFNKEVIGSQFTITAHVDDLKLSHKDPKVVTDMINYLKGLYEELPNGEIKKMSVQRLSDNNRRLNYLGMDFDYSVKGEVAISMVQYVEKVIAEFSEAEALRNKIIKTPASAKLFEIRDNVPKLNPIKKQKFHRIVAQLLYILKRARPDLAPAVPFLTTRVCDPTDDDWKKLRQVIEYLRMTKDMCLILSADKSKPPTWSIDAAHSVHQDCKGHTGGSFTLGKGSAFSVSCKQKINTKSSTESELVAVYDFMSHICWLRHFLLAQGYEQATTVVILQDNRSAILLEQNGRLSSTQRTKHLNNRYFYIKDRIDNKEVRIEWCPTDDMVSDYMSKVLVGEKFKKFRQMIMNLKKGPKLTVLTDQDRNKQTCNVSGGCKVDGIETYRTSRKYNKLSSIEQESGIIMSGDSAAEDTDMKDPYVKDYYSNAVRSNDKGLRPGSNVGKTDRKVFKHSDYMKVIKQSVAAEVNRLQSHGIFDTQMKIKCKDRPKDGANKVWNHCPENDHVSVKRPPVCKPCRKEGHRWKEPRLFNYDPGVKEWTRVDHDCKCFMTTKAGGPRWSDVIARTTCDLISAKVIEHLEVNGAVSNGFLHRRLPEGVCNTKTILYYRTSGSKHPMGKSNHPRKKRRYQRNKKSHKLTRHHTGHHDSKCRYREL